MLGYKRNIKELARDYLGEQERSAFDSGNSLPQFDSLLTSEQQLSDRALREERKFVEQVNKQSKKKGK